MDKGNGQDLARNLGLAPKEFLRLLDSANYAYQVIKDLGPFYGQYNIQEPTFRIAAEPVALPKEAKPLLLQFGDDLLHMGRILYKLPDEYKGKLGNNLEFRVPPTWRIDTILDESGHIRVNEIEGVDGASALMIAEQLAYKLQDLPHSTAAMLVSAFKSFTRSDDVFKIALIWPNVATDPYIPNIKKLINFLSDLSKKALKVELFDEKDLREGIVKPNWEKFKGVIDESYLTPKELLDLGIKDEQFISAGFYNAIVNKGLFALIYDSKLKKFWVKELGKERLERLQKIMIPTKFIETEKQLKSAKRSKKVVKIYWADSTDVVLDRSRGVAMPDGETTHNTKERWEFLKELLNKGVRLIAQEYVKPGKIHAYLRKKGTNLEAVDWYNRICVKYVCKGNPNDEKSCGVDITAVEVTLGPDVVPAGRKCSFTAGYFVD